MICRQAVSVSSIAAAPAGYGKHQSAEIAAAGNDGTPSTGTATTGAIDGRTGVAASATRAA